MGFGHGTGDRIQYPRVHVVIHGTSWHPWNMLVSMEHPGIHAKGPSVHGSHLSMVRVQQYSQFSCHRTVRTTELIACPYRDFAEVVIGAKQNARPNISHRRRK